MDLVFLNILVLYSESLLYLKVLTHIVQEGKGHPPLCLLEPSTHQGSLEASVHQHPAVPPSLMTVQGRNRSSASWRDLAGASGIFGRENGSSLRLLEVALSTEPALGCLNFLYPREVWGFPGGSECEESACSAGDLGSIPGGEGPLEEAMATHSSIFAWRIPGTEEPGGLLSMGSHRVRHN